MVLMIARICCLAAQLLVFLTRDSSLISLSNRDVPHSCMRPFKRYHPSSSHLRTVSQPILPRIYRSAPSQDDHYPLSSRLRIRHLGHATDRPTASQGSLPRLVPIRTFSTAGLPPSPFDEYRIISSSFSQSQAPQIVSLYALNISPSMIREKKRADFERHRGITDVNVIDMLIFKSKQEYQETMNCWKTEVSVQTPRHRLKVLSVQRLGETDG